MDYRDIIKSQLLRFVDIELVVLYGSILETSRFGPNSDIDIAVFSSNQKLDKLAILAELHEIDRNIALIDWFLSQKGPVRGYKNAIFSGLPTVELARVIMNYVLPRSDLFGLYHVASNPINKYDLLKIVANVYEKDIQIIDDETVKINRSLNAKRFNEVTGYIPPDWFTLIKKMHDFG